MRHIERKDFHSLLEGGRRPVGTILQIPSEELVEILGYAGMDYIVLDMEHCPMSSAKIVSMIRAAEAVGIVPLVRVPYVEDEDSIKKALDAGAAGLFIPNISTPEQARLAVQYARFAPIGNRGACPYTRANWFGGDDVTSFYERSNKRTFIALLVEGSEGIENLPEIAKVDGIDAINVGTVDLAVNIGIPGQLNHPNIKNAIKKAAELAAENGKTLAYFCFDPHNAEEVRDWNGVGFYLCTIPESILLNSYEAIIDTIKNCDKK